MTSEVTQADRDFAILACRLTGWEGVAQRLERGWKPDRDTNEGKLLDAAVQHRLTAQSGEGRSGAGEDVEAALRDPNAVHVNMLRGGIARPSVAQIIHIYGEEALRSALNARQSGEGEREGSLVIVECSDPNEGWSLSIKFGSGDHARDKMRAFSDRLRAGEV